MLKIIFLFCLPFGVLAQTLTVQSPLRYLALGDSYTIGQSVSANNRWPEQLIDSLKERGIMVDAMRIIATTGWRTDDLLRAISGEHLEQEHYNLVSLLIGVNNQYQHKSIHQYIVEFPQLLDSAIRYAGGDTSRVFVVSIPDYAATPVGQDAEPEKISTEIEQYNAINRIFAESYGVKYFDITPISKFGLFQPYLVASDGLHPSAIQYTEWVKLILQGNLSSFFSHVTNTKMTVYPNPSDDYVTISYPVKTPKTLEIYDTFGKLIFKKEMNHEFIDISLKELDRGIYIARIVYDNNQYTKYIIKQ